MVHLVQGESIKGFELAKFFTENLLSFIVVYQLKNVRYDLLKLRLIEKGQRKSYSFPIIPPKKGAVEASSEYMCGT